MGSCYAGIHLRNTGAEELLPLLKEAFGKKRGPEPADLAVMRLVEAFARQSVHEIADPGERAAKERLLAGLLNQAAERPGEKALIVVREAFISLYWYDHIRFENLKQQARGYAKRMGVPVLGAAVFDDNNVAIHAACGDMDHGGVYWFDEADMHPAEADRLCWLLDAEFLVPAMEEILACKDGDTMAELFEEKTGLSICMDEDMCRSAGMAELENWEGAVVFRA